MNWTRQHKLSMTNHANNQESQTENSDLNQNSCSGVRRSVRQDKQRGEKSNRIRRVEEAAAVPAITVKTNDERQQIHAQRKHPEQRDDGNFLTNQIRSGQQHRRTASCKRQPQQNRLPLRANRGGREL